MNSKLSEESDCMFDILSFQLIYLSWCSNVEGRNSESLHNNKYLRYSTRINHAKERRLPTAELLG